MICSQITVHFCVVVLLFITVHNAKCAGKRKSPTGFHVSLTNHVDFRMLFFHCLSEIGEIEFFTPLELRGDFQAEDALPCVVMVKAYHEVM